MSTINQTTWIWNWLQRKKNKVEIKSLARSIAAVPFLNGRMLVQTEIAEFGAMAASLEERLNVKSLGSFPTYVPQQHTTNHQHKVT